MPVKQQRAVIVRNSPVREELVHDVPAEAPGSAGHGNLLCRHAGAVGTVRAPSQDGRTRGPFLNPHSVLNEIHNVFDGCFEFPRPTT